MVTKFAEVRLTEVYVGCGCPQSSCDGLAPRWPPSPIVLTLPFTNQPPGMAEDIGRNLLVYGRRIPKAELFARIDAVDAAAVKDVAYRFFNDQVGGRDREVEELRGARKVDEDGSARRRCFLHEPYHRRGQ